ncbi:MAG: amidohydrolase [Synergistales bacterium]|nr:amidohydrolase [Synergistales bacterium]
MTIAREIRNQEEAARERYMELRREIHRNPELSNRETATAALVAQTLRDLGLQVTEGIGGHGVVGLLRGEAGEGGTIGLRADMDALPVQEDTGAPFASERPGVMHACGHDTHTGMMLGVAMVLAAMKRRLKGTVKFVFQPAEENNPTGGAPGMIADGVLERPKVDAMVGLHVWPSMTTGQIGLTPGPTTAASDRLALAVHGKSAHASAPEMGIDAVVIAAQIVSALQTVVSRNLGAQDAGVLTFGVVKGGERYNILPGRVELEGTVRSGSPEARRTLEARIPVIAHGIATAMGGRCELDYIKGYPSVVNDPAVVETVERSAAEVLGSRQVIRMEKIPFASEDFSYFAQTVPSCFYWLGCRPAGTPPEAMPGLHNQGFLPDETALPLGVRIMAATALNYLEGKG